ncbi:ubiquinol-cytochrome-c reductase complex assembly factor 2 [Palaemon carinicauda]|uniref:ubiquinol-cytochrome-c reductase complex assembly factor 2 n=1 Tax=Palaemon carinicauda TaxID=392227 RepID=UPI0035B626FA
MSRNSYRSFLKLLEKWPLDTTKTGGRDLGEHIRQRITTTFKQGDVTVVNEEECHRIYSSLDRLASNVYATKYPRTLQSSSTGLTHDQCRDINSTEFMKAAQEDATPLYAKFFGKK